MVNTRTACFLGASTEASVTEPYWSSYEKIGRQSLVVSLRHHVRQRLPGEASQNADPVEEAAALVGRTLVMSGDRPVVAVVDDDPSVLASLVRLLQLNDLDARPFDSGRSLLEGIEQLTPDCVVADLSMPDLSGLDLQRMLAGGGAHCPIVFVTGHGDIRSSVRAMQAGAVDFLTKPVDQEELLRAVHDAVRRGAQARKASHWLEDVRQRLASLTARERQVFELVVLGYMNKQIASDLAISEKTVKVHRARVMRKMSVKSVAQLARIAEQIELPVKPG